MNISFVGAAHRLFSQQDCEGAMTAYREVQSAYPQFSDLFDVNMTLITIADRLPLLPWVNESPDRKVAPYLAGHFAGNPGESTELIFQ